MRTFIRVEVAEREGGTHNLYVQVNGFLRVDEDVPPIGQEELAEKVGLVVRNILAETCACGKIGK